MRSNCTSPCYQCVDRKIGCHGKCLKYKEYQKFCKQANLKERIAGYGWHD